MKNNFFKKSLLYLLLPFVSGCAANSVFVDDIYYNPKKDTVCVKEDVRKISKKYDFEKSVYVSSFGWDLDNDGIINYCDPWPNIYGPYVDTNQNGILDMCDMQISGFNIPYIINWQLYSDYFWLGNQPNPWRNFYFLHHEYYFQKPHKDYVYKRRVEDNTYVRIKEKTDRQKENPRSSIIRNNRNLQNNYRENNFVRQRENVSTQVKERNRNREENRTQTNVERRRENSSTNSQIRRNSNNSVQTNRRR